MLSVGWLGWHCWHGRLFVLLRRVLVHSASAKGSWLGSKLFRDCVLSRQCSRLLSRLYSFETVFFRDCVLSRQCSFMTVFFRESVLSRLCLSRRRSFETVSFETVFETVFFRDSGQFLARLARLAHLIRLSGPSLVMGDEHLQLSATLPFVRLTSGLIASD